MRIAEGDESAFYSLFKKYYASLILFAERFGLNREDAEDVKNPTPSSYID